MRESCMDGTDASAAEALRQRLLSAFPTAICAEPATSRCGEDCAAINRYLHARAWPEIDQSFVEDFDKVIDLMNERPFHSFLPAWLLFAIRDPGSTLVWSVVSCLEKARTIALFNKDQRRLVRDVAEFLLDLGVLHHGCARGEAESARSSIQCIWCTPRFEDRDSLFLDGA